MLRAMPHPYRPDENLRSLAARLAKEVLAPHAAEVDQQARFPKESVAALAENGLFGPRPPRDFAAVAEELAQGCASTAMIFVMHTTAREAIAASTMPGKQKLLAEIAAGKHLTTLALSESGSRSNFWAPVSHMSDA